MSGKKQGKKLKLRKGRVFILSVLAVVVLAVTTFGVINLVDATQTRMAHAQAISETTQNLANQTIEFSYNGHSFVYTFVDFLSHIDENLMIHFDVDKIYDVLVGINNQTYSYPNIDIDAAMYDALVVLTGSGEGGNNIIHISNFNNEDYYEEEEEEKEAVVQLFEEWIRNENLLGLDLLGTFYTHFNAGETGRNANIQRAAELINNITLAPNQIFNMTDIIGPINIANGYHIALVIRDGEFVEGIGGGVCQVSSTLYMAALFAELEIVQRRAHSRKVGYMPPAFDAVLSIPTLNLRFKNNTPEPITIETHVDLRTSRLTINIWGKETRPEGRSISFRSYRVTTGEEWMTYHLYKYINFNGSVTRTRINVSSYRIEREGEITYYEAITEDESTSNGDNGDNGNNGNIERNGIANDEDIGENGIANEEETYEDEDTLF